VSENIPTSETYTGKNPSVFGKDSKVKSGVEALSEFSGLSAESHIHLWFFVILTVVAQRTLSRLRKPVKVTGERISKRALDVGGRWIDRRRSVPKLTTSGSDTTHSFLLAIGMLLELPAWV